jgi:ubiquitin thioesterase OTU1
MRVRLKGPGGTATLTLADDATIGDLVDQIVEKSAVTHFDVKYGYPPKPLVLDRSQRSNLLTTLDVKLNGEMLTISPKDTASDVGASADKQSAQDTSPAKSVQKTKEAPSVSFSGMSSADSKQKSTKPVSLKKKAMEGEVPEVPMPEVGATLGRICHTQSTSQMLIVLVMRVMPDDNSCLFRAFAAAVLPGDDLSMLELRSLVASSIQADPETYTKVVLEKEPDDYCRWIQTEDAWGGGIELGILSKYFDIQICSIDVQVG